jgi:hypothetical protein
MLRYWVMRVDRDAKPFLWDELKAGRLRQGWGYEDDQDLEVIAKRKAKGAKLSDHQQDTWRGNRRMLASEDDSIQQGDIVLVPHLPEEQHWSVVRVVGPYSYDIAKKHDDYGHILPVELLSGDHPVSFYAEGVAAGLRQTMGVRSRLWNIDHLGAEVAHVVEGLGKPQPPRPGVPVDKLASLLAVLEKHGWQQLQHDFHGAEFEEPCVRLLEAIFGEGAVEHTGGKNENGADAICTYADPLGVTHRIAVQIKMWEGKASWTHPLNQIRKAVESYEGITSGVVISTTEGVTDEFEQARVKLEKELGIPVRILLRRDVLRLFIRHLPGLVAPDGGEAE